MRIGITLFCLTCKEENYRTKKNKSKHPDKAEFNKYCCRCNKKTAHKEKK